MQVPYAFQTLTTNVEAVYSRYFEQTDIAEQFTTTLTTEFDELIARSGWADKETREGYLEGYLESNIAFQIRANRKAREMSQQDLAEMMGTSQAVISRLESSEYGNYSIPTLVKIANAFDCALNVRFTEFSKLAKLARDNSFENLKVESYDDEIRSAKAKAKAIE